MTSAGFATSYATRLLTQLGVGQSVEGEADHPALAWRRAGLMDITGERDGPPLVCPAALASAGDGALLALKELSPGAPLPVSGALLLGERARLLGLHRSGRISPNGSCRLLECSDGRIALNLARSEDWDLLPILLGAPTIANWLAVERAAQRCTVEQLMMLGAELGLPIGRDGSGSVESPFRIEARASCGRPKTQPLVLDFASLWAGPLAGSLLAMTGAKVVKVESRGRPDGARDGNPGFYALLNAGKRSVAVDFGDPADRARLNALVERADIVIEGSRPRALRRLGIDRDAAVARGAIWISITGHDDPDRVGFGDDAAVEGGVSDAMRRGWGKAIFAGDAIADPLTGLHAALAARALWVSGESGMVHLSLSRTTSASLGAGWAAPDELCAWQALAEADEFPLYALRAPSGAARPLGADNALLEDI